MGLLLLADLITPTFFYGVEALPWPVPAEPILFGSNVLRDIVVAQLWPSGTRTLVSQVERLAVTMAVLA